jgi:hypothetical protein
LDRLDDDPVKFWLTVLAALRKSGLAITSRVLVTPQASGPGLWEAVVPALMNELAEVGEGSSDRRRMTAGISLSRLVRSSCLAWMD